MFVPNLGGVPSLVASDVETIIAIDFGTARSGVSFAYVNTDSVFSIYDWPHQPIPYQKAATCVLYDPSRKPVAFSNTALHEYASLPPNKRRDYSLLQNFKMALFRGGAGGNGGTVTCHETGERFDVVDVVTDYLRYLFQHVCQYQTERDPSFEKSLVFCCLTVPAIWNDEEKDAMRRAAKAAGINTDDGYFMFALEPEAAAVYCTTSRTTTISGKVTHMKDLPPEGCNVMIFDVGGGTCDVTMHHVDGVTKHLSEIVEGSGGPWGSMQLDKRFWELLCARFGQETIDTYRREHSLDALRFGGEWERAKCNLASLDDTVSISVPVNLYHIIAKHCPSETKQLGATGTIVLSPDDLGLIYRPVLDSLIKLAQDQLARLQSGSRIDRIVLVGGFGKSRVLLERMTREFETDKTKVVRPVDPGIAVLEGACRFGLDPKMCRSRRARYTYGIAVNIPPVVGRPTQWIEGREYDAVGGLDVIVRVRDEVTIGQCERAVYFPVRELQKAMALELYRTELHSPKYSDDPGVTLLGLLHVAMPDTTGGRDRNVNVRLYFGGTEIKVKAVDSNTGCEFATTFAFSSSPITQITV